MIRVEKSMQIATQYQSIGIVVGTLVSMADKMCSL